MFKIFASKDKQELMLVFDIRSSSVGGALFRVEKSGVPKIILSLREPILEGGRVSVDKFLVSTLKSLETVAGKILKAGLGAPKDIFCVLASPWYISQTRIINLKKDKPFVFSLKLADEMIKKEIEAFKTEHLDKYVKSNKEIRVIEIKNLKTILNGYETHKPLDQKVNEAEMTLFVSMSPEQILRNIEEAIKKHFHHNSVKFSSFAMASFAVMHNMFLDQPNFLLIDIGGELTDVSMVKKKAFSESVSFPLGHYSLIRGVSSALSCTKNEAESYISLLNSGHADTVTENKLTSIINTLKMEWLKMFQESLANLSRDISIPYIIYLSAEPAFINFFSQVIASEQFNQYTLTESKFKIISLNTDILHGIVEFEKETFRDPFTMVSASYINNFLIYPEKLENK